MHDKKILIADDDHSFRTALEDMILAWGYEVMSAKNGMDVWEILLREDAPRMMILDWVMPGMDGLEICRRLRSRQEDPYFYIILVTINDQTEQLTEAIAAGADDYLTKPVFPEELEARLLVGKRILDFQSDLISARDALRVQATQDPLTSLMNRKGILEVLAREVSRASRNRMPLSVIMADVDCFKYVNDTFGHIMGDRLLVEVAERMRKTIRNYDALGRYGGDEFLMVLPGCDAEAAVHLAERVQEQVESASLILPGEASSPITLSMGVASSSMGIELVSEELIWEADSALLRAKQMGKNRVEVRHSIQMMVM